MSTSLSTWKNRIGIDSDKPNVSADLGKNIGKKIQHVFGQRRVVFMTVKTKQMMVFMYTNQV